MDRVQFSARLDLMMTPDQRDRMLAAAVSSQTSASEFVRQAVADRVEKVTAARTEGAD